MRQSLGVFVIFLISHFALISECHAKPESLAALFQNPKTKKTKVKKEKTLPIPSEYEVYFKGKRLLDQKTDRGSIEAVERKILEQKLSSNSRSLEKELEDLFYALEIKRGSLFSKSKSYDQALNAWNRGLTGLQTFKWIYYWKEEDSKLVSKTCTRSKKKKDEVCLTLAKRIVDAFPKSANETKALRDLPGLDPIPSSEMSAERLSQSYTEKQEKDEVAFQDVLENFLSGKEVDTLKSGKDFISEFPKSILRFRALFLMAEVQFKRGDKKEAQSKYLEIIDNVPLSFYSIVSAERLGINLRERIKKDPIQIDLDVMNPNLQEKHTLDRARALFQNKHPDEVGIELDTLSRYRNYNTDLLLYLMKFAHEADQNLVTFKIANELIQRRYENLLHPDFLALIFPDRYIKEIEASASANKIDPLVVQSLMKQESGFKAAVLSSSGALGLMQLMPFTAIDTKKDIVLSSLKEPKSNIEVGTKYIASLLNQYEGNIPYALAAYNAGPHRVGKWRKDAKENATMIEWIEAIPYKETREYVMAILRNRYWYQYRHGQTPDSVFASFTSGSRDAKK